MAQTSPVLTQETCEHTKITSVPFSNIIPMDSVLAVDEEIPTIDFFMLFSDDPIQQSKALDHLSYACDEYGFFYLVNHGVPDTVIEGALEGIAEFFEVTKVEEKKEYRKSNPADRIMWGLNCHAGENREYLKVVAHPHLHCPAKPAIISEVLEEYFERFQDVKTGLARAISKILGFEEGYIEKVFDLTSGFDVAAMNVYPPNFQSKGSIGVPSHTDPGFFVSLIQDVDGGLRVLSHKGKWINVYIPRNSFLIQIGDHLEILTNGKYKSHVHQVVVDNNKVRRISLATLHGPSLDTLVIPASEFVDQFHPPGYRGTTYKESLEANGHYEIEVQSCLEQLRL
ncbi:2-OXOGLUTARATE (2OG) AND FE(II)-DEPENDENT OXYGENASE SUPERFAMILY PROTEIN-RELATED [Salix koriyanagi]|uniref:2-OXOGLUTARATE (2OG) AND FE(II)-DEPENDENT OXYGENASE SUPERFAMILY PROTEIN-RELATED n=2 Tax=Salix TaxID=40685 RepID=A0A9Q0P4P3_9ROSI|nr:2-OXOGLUTARATE (2OG) AND FE(II)-DEPENDENT OXYGENASE SUPERFAMILY PROTEIN-RELATED [Salix koriyanagi]